MLLHLHRIAMRMGTTPGAGMDLICCVLFEAQQEYFDDVNGLATGNPPAVPTFGCITRLVNTFRAGNLANLPDHWYHIVDAPRPARDIHGMMDACGVAQPQN